MGEYIKAWGKSDETWADEAIPECVARLCVYV